ncbi:MAG: hypothetical protein B7Z55_16185, partial [Planctomycetales bacterium 12-60-4]
TFGDRQRADFWSQYVSYCASCLVGAVVNWGTSVALWYLVPSLQSQPWVPPLFGVIAGMGFNYVLCRLWVFRDHSPLEVSKAGELKTESKRSTTIRAA